MEEDRRNKEPKNMEARKRRAEYILQEEEQKAACLAEGKDWEIEKLRWAKCSLINSKIRICSVADPVCLTRIQDSNFFYPGSASKNLSILTQKIVSKLSEI